MSIFKRPIGSLLGLSLWLYSCTGVFFQPTRDLYPVDYLKGFKKKDILIESADGTRLHGWIVEPQKTPKGTVVFYHGNAENLRTHTEGVLFLVRANYRLIVFDYRGYGLSEGTPDIDGVYQDAEAALRMAIRYSEDKGVVLLGQSLGGAIAVYIAATSPLKGHIKAVIVDSAFCGYRAIAREKLDLFFLTAPFSGILKYLVVDRYSPLRYASRLDMPVLFVHGLQDRVVPPYHSYCLYEKVKGQKAIWFVYGAGHIQSFRSRPLQERLLQWMETIK